jgi:hypothetical protein
MAAATDEAISSLRGWAADESSADEDALTAAPEDLVASLGRLNQWMEDELEAQQSSGTTELPAAAATAAATAAAADTAAPSEHLMAEGLGEVACRLAARWPEDEALQEKVLDTLTLLCKSAGDIDDSSIEALVAAGWSSDASEGIGGGNGDASFVAVLSGALRRHQGNALVQSSALCLLGAAGQVKAAAEFLLQQEVAVSIATALEFYCKRAEELSSDLQGHEGEEAVCDCHKVAKYCLMAVWNFCMAVPPPKNSSRNSKRAAMPVAAGAFVEAGLVEKILHAMRALPRVEDVAHWGCGALFIVLKHEPRAREIAQMLHAERIADDMKAAFPDANWLPYAQKMRQQLGQQGWSSWKDADPRLLSRADRKCQTSGDALEMPSPSKRRRTQRSTAGSDGRLIVSRAELRDKYVTKRRFKELWHILQDVGWHGPHRNPNRLGTSDWLYCSKSAPKPQSARGSNLDESQETIEEGVNAFSDLDLIVWLADGTSRDEGLRSVQIGLCNVIVQRMKENEEETVEAKDVATRRNHKPNREADDSQMGGADHGMKATANVPSAATKAREGYIERADGADAAKGAPKRPKAGRDRSERRAKSSRRQSYESDEVLWAKLGNHPWWPGQEILNPSQDRLDDFHNQDDGAGPSGSSSVCVRFLPFSKNEWSWVKNGQVLRPYQRHRDDIISKLPDKVQKQKGLQAAIAEADKLCRRPLVLSDDGNDNGNGDSGPAGEHGSGTADGEEDSFDNGAQASAGNALLLKAALGSGGVAIGQKRAFTQASGRSDSYFGSRPKGRPILASSSGGGGATGKKPGSNGNRSRQHRSVRNANAKLARIGGGGELLAKTSTKLGDTDRQTVAPSEDTGDGGIDEEAPLPELTWPTKVELALGGGFGPSSQLVSTAHQQTPSEHKQAMQLLLAQLKEEHFKDWGAFVKQGAFNLLLYGFGSKLDLLDKFRKEELGATIVLEARGFEATMRIETILNLLADDLLHCKDELFSEDVSTYARNLVAWLGPRRPRPPPMLTWKNLKDRGGWTYSKGRGLQSYLYLRPGVSSPDGFERGVHFFDEEHEAVTFARKHGVDFNTRMGHIDEPMLGSSISSGESLLSSARGFPEDMTFGATSLCYDDPLDAVDDPSAVGGAPAFGTVDGDNGGARRRRGTGGAGGHEVIVIMIHSLDGNPFMRHRSAQAALSILASSSRISVVASVDHVNAALLWDMDLATKFNWLWWDATTYAEYDREAKHILERTVKAASQGKANGRQGNAVDSDESKRDPRPDNEIGLAWPSRKSEGITSILDSFSSRQIKVLKLLCDTGRSELSSTLSIEMTRTELLKECRRRNFAKDDHDLDNILRDPMDHKLIQQVGKRQQGNLLYVDPAVIPFIEAHST